MTASVPPAPTRPAPPPIRLWRQGALLVVRRGAPISGPSCLRCGARGAQPTTIIGVYGDRIDVPVCPRHRKDLHRSEKLLPGLVAAGTILAIVGCVMDSVLLALPGLYLAIASHVTAAVTKQGLSLVTSETDFIQLRGVDSRFLERQRRWEGYPEPIG